jgi:acyl-coenzyme A thioesterase 13
MGRIPFDELKKLEGQYILDSPSAAGNWLKPKLIRIEKNFAIMEVLVQHDMCNPYGHIHGGMMALVMDESIGWAILAADLPVQYTSVSLNIDFLYAAPKGSTIFAHARIIRAGKKILNAEVHVYNESNTLIGHATSNLVSTGMEVQNNY